MCILGLGGCVFEVVGGFQVFMFGSELYINLECGVIDVIEWFGLFYDIFMGFYEIVKYYYMLGWYEFGIVLEFFVNKEKFDEFSFDFQVIMCFVFYYMYFWCWMEFEKCNVDVFVGLVDKGVDFC